MQSDEAPRATALSFQTYGGFFWSSNPWLNWIGIPVGSLNWWANLVVVTREIIELFAGEKVECQEGLGKIWMDLAINAGDEWADGSCEVL